MTPAPRNATDPSPEAESADGGAGVAASRLRAPPRFDAETPPSVSGKADVACQEPERLYQGPRGEAPVEKKDSWYTIFKNRVFHWKSGVPPALDHPQCVCCRKAMVPGGKNPSAPCERCAADTCLVCVDFCNHCNRGYCAACFTAHQCPVLARKERRRDQSLATRWEPSAAALWPSQQTFASLLLGVMRQCFPC